MRIRLAETWEAEVRGEPGRYELASLRMDKRGRNEEVVAEFYDAFSRADHSAMAAAYGSDAHFSDPAFGSLHGRQIAAMWHMLCEGGDDLEVSLRSVRTDSRGDVRARWEARYTFGPDARRVRNRIDARIELVDGKIVEHHDVFDMWRWARMAVGWPGWLAGWSPWLKGRVRAQARRSLERFIADHPEYGSGEEV